MSVHKKITSLATFVSTTAFAASGGWTSGGGELFQDAQNPWFIQNTSQANYCVEFDVANFGVAPERAEAILNSALAYWKREFSATSPVNGVHVATQEFVKTDCTDETDLRFQFGFLTDEQKERIPDPGRFAALAIRTSYDRTILRGKGFVYVAPQQGPLKVQGSNIVENPWSQGNGGLLYKTLVHELGHVFGLPHTENTGTERIMSHHFVERILDKKNAGYHKNIVPLSPYFRLDSQVEGRARMECMVSPLSRFDTARRFFGIEADWACIGTRVVAGNLEIYAAKSILEKQQLIGVARFPTTQNDSFNLRRSSMSFWLPPEQKVFPGQSKVEVPAYSISDRKGLYTNHDRSISREIFVRFDPTLDDPFFDDLKIGGVMDGKLFIHIKEGI